MSREQGEFFELEFGFERVRKVGPVYVLSFRWPREYIPNGIIEIVDDKAKSLWRRQVTDADIAAWQNLVQEDLVSKFSQPLKSRKSLRK